MRDLVLDPRSVCNFENRRWIVVSSRGFPLSRASFKRSASIAADSMAEFPPCPVSGFIWHVVSTYIRAMSWSRTTHLVESITNQYSPFVKAPIQDELLHWHQDCIYAELVEVSKSEPRKKDITGVFFYDILRVFRTVSGYRVMDGHLGVLDK